jgi:hypothetical protein
MRRVVVRVVGLAGLLLGLSAGLVGVAPTAGAVSGVQAGYWQQHPGVAQVPAGGFEVASDPTGTQAVAAIRFTLDSGESQPILHVKLSQVVPDTSQLALIACPVSKKSASWAPPSGAGAWTDAPQPDCTGGTATGKLSDDKTTVTFDLSTMSFDGSTVDVLLSPDLVTSPVPSGVVDGVGGQAQPTFDAAFAPVTADQVEVSGGGSDSGSSGPLTGGGGPVSSGASTPPATSGGAQPSYGGLGTALPSGSGVAALPAPGAASAPLVASSPQPQAVQQQQPVAAAGGAPARQGRNLRLLFAVAMLSADLLFGLLWLQRKHDNDPNVRPLISIYDPPPAPVAEPG